MIWIQTNRLMVFLEIFFQMADLEKKTADDKMHAEFTSMQSTKDIIFYANRWTDRQAELFLWSDKFKSKNGASVSEEYALFN